jgi:hypothetical protein
VADRKALPSKRFGNSQMTTRQEWLLMALAHRKGEPLRRRRSRRRCS